jgi:hypothetical protein
MITDDELRAHLCQNGDSRSNVLANGLTRYATSPQPIKHLAFGSCTASTISEEAWEKLMDMNREEMSWQEVKRRFLEAIGLEGMELQVVFTPSGTDAETFVSHVLVESSDKILRNVLVAPNEIGGGSVIAAAALRFDHFTPDGSIGEVGDVLIKRINDKVITHKIGIRNEVGELLAQNVVSDECSKVFTIALEQNEQILVHLVAGSKTSVHTPSRYFLEEKKKSIGQEFHILVDAAQGRFSRSGIKTCLEKGWIVMTTGSKFFGGPPFSSVILFPSKYQIEDKWNDDLSVLFDPAAIFPLKNYPTNSNRIGPLVRWYAALNEIENYYQIPKKRRFRFFKWFEEDAVSLFNNDELIEVISIVPEGIDTSSRLLQSNLTVLTFKLRNSKSKEWYSVEELRAIHISLMENDLGRIRVHLGQPVAITSDSTIGALRLAFGGVLMQQLNKIVDDSGSMGTARMVLGTWLKSAMDALLEQLSLD